MTAVPPCMAAMVAAMAAGASQSLLESTVDHHQTKDIIIKKSLIIITRSFSASSVRRMQKCEASLLINSLLSMHSALSFRYCGSCCNVLSATAAQRDFQNKSYSLPRTLVTFYSQIDISIISAS